MRIAVWHDLPSGGGKRALYDHVRGLLQRGHELEAWCPPTADREFLPLAELVTEHVVALPEFEPSRFRRQLTELTQDRRLHIDAMTEHCRLVANELEARDFDVLLAGPCQFFRATAIGRVCSLPSVLYLQEPFRWLYEALPNLVWVADDRPTGWWHSPNAVRNALREAVRIRSLRVQAREEVRNARGFSEILVNSFYSRESILRAYGLDATVCYLGVDTDLFRPTSDRREPFLITVGSGTPEKNVGFLVQAIALCKRKMPLVWVANVVDDGYASSVKRLAVELDVELVIKQRIPDAELVALLNQATAMVYAPRLEPFGFAPLEAGACALPVVAVAEGGVRETVIDGETGLISHPKPDLFAECIDAITGDIQLATRLGENGRRHVQAFFSLSAGATRLEKRLVTQVASRESPTGGLQRRTNGSAPATTISLEHTDIA